MTEAIFGLIGVLVGSLVPWCLSYWTKKREIRKNGRYLAIRIICVLDKYLDDCVEVVKDDGLSCGQRNANGCLEAQVKTPGAPVYPEDVDWKSIDHELMFKILSLPSEVETAERLIKGAAEISDPPDFEDWFTERGYWYCQFGLIANKLVDELCVRYEIRKKAYHKWNPQEDLTREMEVLNGKRQRLLEGHSEFVERVFRRGSAKGT